tara:strand:- start:83 stop:598 length:516 start_codon:yes stop_codon:yes gene_type:complete
MRRLRFLNAQASRENQRERIALTYEVSKLKAKLARAQRPPDFGNVQDVLSEGVAPRKNVFIDDQSVRCELALTDAQRTQGLMFRNSLPQGEGMLFVFPKPMQQSFWMKNTKIPLDVAFADEKGMILNVEAGVPGSPRRMLSRGPAMYVVEVPMGWFEGKGLGPGSIIKFEK